MASGDSRTTDRRLGDLNLPDVGPADDFSDRFGPVVVRDLRQGLRARRFVGPFLLLQVLAILALLSELFVAEASAAGAGSSSGFGTLLLMQVIALIVGLVMPLSGFAALQPELGQERNVELLLLANLSRWQIVLGNWLVMSSLAGLVIVSLMPYLLVRYFLGGVELVETVAFAGGVVLFNLTMNAAVIGASAYRNYIGRVLVLGIIMGSFLITAMIVMAAAGAGVASWGGTASTFVFAVLVAPITSALYCVFGLQVGRAKLRLYENPIDPPPSGLLIAMMMFTPLVAGMFSLGTEGFGPPFVCVGLTLVVLAVDRGPGKNKKIRFAQP